MADSKQQKKNGKKNKQKAVSLMEINERAADRVHEIQRANALKSQEKIKQLTEEHKKNKANKAKPVVDADVIMDSDEEEKKESTSHK